jgi:hypothetical protein
MNYSARICLKMTALNETQALFILKDIALASKVLKHTL